MASLRLKIQKARNTQELDACLEELRALLRLASERAAEFQAEDEVLNQFIAEVMPPEFHEGC